MDFLKTQIKIEKFSANINKNLPILFDKKCKITTSKQLAYIKADTGLIRHFTPAAQEWDNSIYSYDSNYIKTLPTADKNLMNILRGYFNFQLNEKPMQNEIEEEEELSVRFKRISTKRVFIGKGELKHTSNKVLITFYVLNTEGMWLNQNYENVKRDLFYPGIELKQFVKYDRNGEAIISYNRPLTPKEFLDKADHDKLYDLYTMSIINKYANSSDIELLNTYYEHLSNLVETNNITENEKRIMFLNKILIWKPIDYLKFEEVKFESVKHFREKKLRYFYHLLNFNKVKFTNFFMSKLIYLVRKLYNKEVIFNIVKLKKMHLNSDIYTQIISLKLRNKQNNLKKVFKASLRKINLPAERKINGRIARLSKDVFFVNRIRNNVISSMFNDYNDRDSLNNLLLTFYPAVDNIKINIKKIASFSTNLKKKQISLNKFVLNHHLKHLKLRGLRIEAKGRLNRRATASRSVFKLKWLGGLKNVDSSFRGLSTIMLRGYHKSNVQYTVIHSKNPSGAFGVKGWVSSK